MWYSLREIKGYRNINSYLPNTHTNGGKKESALSISGSLIVAFNFLMVTFLFSVYYRMNTYDFCKQENNHHYIK